MLCKYQHLALSALLATAGTNASPLQRLVKHPEAGRNGEPQLEVGLDTPSYNWGSTGFITPSLSSSRIASGGLQVDISNSPAAAFTSKPHWYNFDFDVYSEIQLSYAVYFPEDFAFSHGGRLPGIVGGAPYATQPCSLSPGVFEPESQSESVPDISRDSCFALHVGWSNDGSVRMQLTIHPVLGSAIMPGGRSSGAVVLEPDAAGVRFPSGAWTQLAVRVRLNTPERSDGLLQLWVNGTRVKFFEGLELRVYDSSRFRGVDLGAFAYGPTYRKTTLQLSRFSAAALFEDGSPDSPSDSKSRDERPRSGFVSTNGWKSLTGAAAILAVYLAWKRLRRPRHSVSPKSPRAGRPEA